MSPAPAHPRDPIGWCWGLAAAFWLLCFYNLGIPTKPYFDEIHYLPAARELLALGTFTNREHPLLSKELIALGIALFGDNPMGWRLFPSLSGALTLFAAMRALWFASLSRYATVGYGVLLFTGFHLFVQSRIAMLDGFMVTFLMVMLWQLAAAMREPETGRIRLFVAGVALGLTLAAKWNAVSLALVPGVGFFLLRLRAGRRRLLFSRRGAPVPGVSLAEAFVWLGLLPLAVYTLTYLPAFFFAHDAIAWDGLFAFQREMIFLQESVVKPHPYQSNWKDWVINRRVIWYLYENIDGAQRGIMLIGNPLTMLLGLPALVWCLWRAVTRRSAAHGAVVVLYMFSLGLWIVAEKPIQFYYHYFLPSMFLLAALALALDDLRRTGWRWLATGVLVASTAFFAGFYPILSAMPLSGPRAFATWAWFDSWR